MHRFPSVSQLLVFATFLESELALHVSNSWRHQSGRRSHINHKPPQLLNGALKQVWLCGTPATRRKCADSCSKDTDSNIIATSRTSSSRDDNKAGYEYTASIVLTQNTVKYRLQRDIVTSIWKPFGGGRAALGSAQRARVSSCKGPRDPNSDPVSAQDLIVADSSHPEKEPF